jgi:hypothetical protein
MGATEEEMIERRSRNADAAIFSLAAGIGLFDWIWLIGAVTLLLVFLVIWLLG